MNRKSHPSHPLPAIIEELEPRLLLSADLPGLEPAPYIHDDIPAEVVIVEANNVANDGQRAPELALVDETQLQRELIIIDAATPDYQTLVDDILKQSDNTRQLDIILLDTNQDGISQITQALSQYQNLDAVHLISHASDGEIQLGNTSLNSQSLQDNLESLKTWNRAFSEDGDLLIYGCELAATESGRSLVDSLAKTTGADVAASDDLTGHINLGGDWDLEYNSGVINSGLVFSESFQATYFEVLGDLTGTWTGSGTGPSTSISDAPSSVTVTATTTTTGNADVSITPNGSMTTNAFFSNAAVQGAASFDAVLTWDSTPDGGGDQASDDAGSGTITFTFDKAVTNPILHIDRLGGSGGSLSNSSLWTVTTAGASLTKLAGVNHLEVVGSTFYRTPNGTNSGNSEATADSTDGTAAGSIQINGTYTSLTFDWAALGVEGAGGDGVELAWELTEAPPITPDDIQATASSDGGLSLNEDGGNDAYVIADDGGSILGGLTNLTVEMQLSTTQFGLYTPLFSYNTATDNELLAILDSNGHINLYVAGISRTLSGYDFRTLNDGEAHGITVTWSNTSGDWEVFVDGQSKGGGSGLATGDTIDAGGTLIFGQEQDSIDGSYDSGQRLQATLYDARIFDDVRTDAEILSNYNTTLPYNESGLIANWTFNDLSTNGIITDTVSGNNLTVKHASGGGFVTSTPELNFQVDENVVNGTVIGAVTGTDTEREALIASLLASNPSLSYSEETGKFYETINTTGTWSSAQTAAQSTTLNGIAGQLVTILSATENELVLSIANSLGRHIWIGASDQSAEGTWNWYQAATPATTFWQGTGTGYAPGNVYTNWQSGEPNDGSGIEDFAYLAHSTGQWNDTTSAESSPIYIVEWNADEVLDVNQALTYSIQSQTSAGAFAIDADSGEITVTDTVQIDYESATSHNLTIRVTDVTGNYRDEVMAIQINNQGGEPTLSLPGAQNLNEDTTLTFSSGNGNAITVDDTSSSDSLLQVTLNTNNGILSLSQTTGLTLVGGSYDSSHMVIDGSESDINAALEGMVFTPTADYTGAADIQIKTAQANSLVGDYSFEAGDAADNSAGVQHNGVLMGNASIVTDAERGEVLSLDGTGDYVQIDGNFSQPANVTLSAWVNADSAYVDIFSANNNLILRVDDPNDGRGLVAIYNDGSTYQITPSGQWIAGTGWHHVALTFDDSTKTMSLYIDGNLSTESIFSNSISYDTGNFYIGSNSGSSLFFDGMIDDARIYSRALNADEIATLAIDQSSDFGIVNITVNPVNDAPVLTTTPGGGTHYENASSGVYIDTTTTVTDIDSADFDGGQLTVTITGNGEATDRLYVRTEGTGIGQVDLSGSDVTYNFGAGSVVVGTVSGGIGDADPLVITFNSNADATAVSEVAKQVAFLTVSDSPNTNQRSIELVITDGDGGVSNTGNRVVNVVAVNDAPVLDNSANLTLTPQSEDSGPPTGAMGTVITDLVQIGGNVTDADTGSQTGVAITDADTTNGTWWYTTNAGTNWSALGSVSDASARLLNANSNTRIYFQSDADFNGTISDAITFRAWDRSSDSSGSLADTTTNGDISAFSSSTEMASITITPVNDAPMVGNLDGDILNYTEGDGAVLLEQDGNAAISDVDSPDFSGGTVNVEIDSGVQAGEDILSIQNLGTGAGQIGVSGNDITYGGVIIGSYTGGTGLVPLNVVFNANATSTAVAALVQNITYENTNTDNPATNVRSVTIDISDGDGGSSTTQNLTINVTGTNDAPVITSGNTHSVAENSTAITTVTANDLDGDTLSFNIIGGPDQSRFNLNSTTGVLTFSVAPNFESPTDGDLDNVYSATVQVNDSNGGLVNQTINVTVTDINESAVSAVSDSNANANTVPENYVVGTQVGITGFADDADGSDSVTYSLSDDAGGLFTIDTNTGIVTIANALDYETATSHSITVLATSSDTSTSSQAFTITITDENEYSTGAVSDSDVTANTVAEDAIVGATVGVTGFSDDLDGSDTITYSLSDDAGGLFTIDTNTGVITVANTLDYETATSHSIAVQASSSDGSSSSQIFTINVTDINESAVGAVSDTNANANTVAENYIVGTQVGITGFADDVDGSDTVTYSLSDDAGGLFTIDTNTGVVTIANALDYESATSHSITVLATSSDTSTSSQAFTINITDENEYSTGAVSDTNATANTVAEDAIVGTTVGITSFADDSDGSDTVTYSLFDDAGGLFTIDTNTGIVTVANALDYETATSHSITVLAESSDASSSSQVFTINITDVSESAVDAVSDTNAAVNTIAENAIVGTTVGITGFADDADVADTVTYSLSDDAGGLFTIDTNTGVVTVANTLDYESATSHNITVLATSSDTSTSSQAFTINITDINESAVGAVFDANTAANTIAENVSGGSTVGIIAFANDTDGTDTVTYSLSDDAGGLFTIDTNTGIVTVANTLDYETATSHNITVLATSSDTSTSSQAFTINITDVNESVVGAVSDTNATANTVAEDAIVGATVGITGFADDVDGTDTVTYSLSDNAGGLFTIDTNTGIVTVANALDYESAASHNITVLATSSDTSTSSQAFTINITDVNESVVGAVSDTNAAANTVAEDAIVGATVGITGFANDTDGTDTVTYSLSDDAGGLFTIDTNTGIVTVANALDYESAASHNITVLATSSDTSTSSQAFTINITDINESPTAITLSNTSVDENTDTSGGHTVGSLATTDEDTGDTTTYMLIGGPDQAKFSLSGSDLILTDGVLDHEAQASYSVTVQVTDGGGNTFTQALTVTVNDLNEAPSFNSTPVTTATEDSAYNYNISTSDPDSGAILTINPTTMPAWLTLIDNGDGTATLSGTPTNAEIGTHSLVVEVSDGSLTDTQSFTITVSNTNDAPVIVQNNLLVNGDLTSDLANWAPTGNVEWAGGETRFGGVGGPLGTLSQTFTTEIGSTYYVSFDYGDRSPTKFQSIQVQATGSGNLLDEVITSGVTENGIFPYSYAFIADSTTTTLLLTDTSASHSGVRGYLDNIFLGKESPALESINTAENQTSVTTVTATDVDGDTLTFNISGGADSGLFSITSDGILTFNSGRDFETFSDTNNDGIYEVDVTANDGNGGTDVQSISVTVTDVNESIGGVSDTDLSANTAAEDAIVSSTVGITGFADDVDGSDTVTYSLSDDAGGLFTIDTNTGVVTIANALDYESAISHNITVLATSSDTSTSSQAFTINITDVNESAVSAVSDMNASANTVAEDAIVGSTVGITGFADDADGTDTITYSLSDDAGGLFTVDTNTGVVTVANALDYESATSHNITVLATSSDTSTNSQAFTINITDVNESVVGAVSDTNAAANTVAEDAIVGAAVGVTGFADDMDGSDTVTYSLSDDAGGLFTIDTNTGVVTIANALDYESAISHNITVLATSSDTSTSSQAFTINITDVNESAVSAVSDMNASANTVAEDAIVGTTVGITGFADDMDGSDTVTYSLSDDAGGLFTIDTNTGVVTIANALDYESAISHNITVLATSSDTSTSSQAFTINITDVNESAVSAISDMNASANTVAEDAIVGMTVGITGFADDMDGTDTVTYSLSDNAGGLFTIDSNTGVVTVANALNYESSASHNITVLATSSDTSTSSQAFTINITDVNESAVGAVSDTNIAANTVAEDAIVGSTVGITGFADDADGTDTITYSLSDDAGGLFTIDSNTGVVTVANALDYESATSHNITVLATSSDTSTSSQAFTINITDVNESVVGAVSDTNAAANTVAEDAIVGAAVGVTGFADDMDGSDTVTYSLSDDAGGLFTIDTNTGVVAVANTLDYESATSHNITVLATSSDTSTSSQTFTINISDLNDNSPVTSNASVGLSENSINGTLVHTVIASDADGSAPNNALSYAIIGGNTGGAFTIDASGNITVANSAMLDFETTLNFTLTVTVSDGGIPSQSDTATISINLNDANDNAPSIPGGQTFIINENSSNGTSVGFISATDIDTVGTFQDWQITGGTGSTAFSINAVTGEISVIDGTQIDYETSPSFTLDVTVSDGTNISPTQSVIINLDDINEVPATIGISNITVNEDAANTIINVFNAFSDAEDLAPALTYTLSNNTNTGLFNTTSLDNVAGTLTLDYALNQSGSADITLRATDTGGLFVETTFTVTVNPINDAPINTVPGSQSTQEDTPFSFAGINGNLISIGDIDAGINPIGVTLNASNGSILLSTTTGLTISGGANGTSSITFTGTTSDINTALDGLQFSPTTNFNGSASLQIITDDQGNSGLGGTQIASDTISIAITSENDIPVAANDSYILDEDTPLTINSGFNDLLANDNDADGNTLSINTTPVTNTANGSLSLNNNGTFTYVPNTNFYGVDSFTYEVSDGYGGTDTATVTLTVNPANDAPVNTLPNAQTIFENQPLVFSISNANAISISDIDAETSHLQLSLSANNGTLTISDTSGLTFISGNGTDDKTMTFTGSTNDINAALEGLTFTPNPGYTGTTSIELTTNDLGNTGSGNILTDINIITITVQSFHFIEATSFPPPPPIDSSALGLVISDPETQEDESPEALVLSEAKEGDEKLNLASDLLNDLDEDDSTFFDQSSVGSSFASIDMSDESTRQILSKAIKAGIISPYIAQMKTLKTLEFLTINGYQLVEHAIWDALDNLNDELSKSEHEDHPTITQEIVFKTTAGVTFSLSVGYITWLAQSGTLAASMLSMTPLWTQFDPIPLLKATETPTKKGRGSADSRKPADKQLDRLFD